MSLEELDDDHLLALYIVHKEGEKGALRINLVRKLGKVVGEEVTIQIIEHLKGKYMIEIGTSLKMDGNRPRWTPVYKILKNYRETLSMIPSNKPDVYKRFLRVPDNV